MRAPSESRSSVLPEAAVAEASRAYQMELDVGPPRRAASRVAVTALESSRASSRAESGLPEYRRVDVATGGHLDVTSQSLLVCGDACRALAMIPDGVVRTVVTSPPYWSLRDYGVDDQIGRDDDLGDYVEKIVSAFEQIRRVLRDDGTVWLNVGDSYTSGNRRYRAPDRKNRARSMAVRPPTPQGLKPKDLIGVPWRLALALQEAGWWLRAEVIWHKPNAHPESVRDRPTRAHETIFLLSKGQNYFYRVDAVQGPNQRRLRSVWNVNTEPRRGGGGDAEDHPAVMPMTLAQRCVAITSAQGELVLDPYAGSGTSLLAARALGRRWIGIELKPSFVDLIERRLRSP